MYLRLLEYKDAPQMLEWMHDLSVVEYLQTDFSTKTLTDCMNFICNSRVDTSNLHMAIADDNDEYLGTVSLKNSNYFSAEFAITVRTSAMGKGISRDAMEKILDIGFESIELDYIYWCVSPENKRAVRFYDKNGYHRVSPDPLNMEGDSEEQIQSYYWYLITREERRNRVSEKIRRAYWITNQKSELNMDVLFLLSIA